MDSNGEEWSKYLTAGMSENGPKLLSNQIFIISAAISMLIIGTTWGWPSPALIILTGQNPPFNITREEIDRSISLGTLGAVPGPLIGTIFINIVGRKPIILFTAIPYFTSWMLIYFATSAKWLYAGRFLVGFTLGTTMTVVPLYIREIASPEIRGKLANLNMLLIKTGSLIAFSIGYYVSFSTNALIMSSIPILFFAVFLIMPETPYYYIWVNKKERALQTLGKLRESSLNNEVDSIAQRIESEKNIKILDVLKEPANQKALGLLCGAFAAHQFSGITAVMAYAANIFAEIDSSIGSVQVNNIIFGATGVCSVLVSGYLVDRIGRRILFIMSGLGTIFAYCVIATYLFLINRGYEISQYSAIPTIFLILIPMTFGFGLGPLPYVYMSEIIAPNFKSFASCACMVFSNLLAYIIMVLFPIMIRWYGIAAVLYGFAGLSTIAVIFAVVCLPETKCQTLEEIQDSLRSSSWRS